LPRKPTHKLYWTTASPSAVTNMRRTALRETLLRYNVWGYSLGIVNIPEERWMTIPLIDC